MKFWRDTATGTVVLLFAKNQFKNIPRPEPFKFINFAPDTKVEAKVDGDSVTLLANRPVKGVVLDVDGADVKWSDQALDIVPDDPQTVCAVGLNGRQIKLRYLGDGTA